MNHQCLNCETELKGSYCHKCGQKSSTHRITFAKFVQHDLIHGIFHLDKGVLYTLKTLIYSPGYAAKNFIAGKRVMHYNIFALFIIVIALKTLVSLQTAPGTVFTNYNKAYLKTDAAINETIQHYYKIFYLLSIPMLSLFSFAIFRRLKYNFVEHIVFNCFLMAGGFLYALLFSILGWITGIETLDVYGLCFMALYLMVGYYQGAKGLYSFFGYLWRSLCVLLLFLLSIIIVFLTIIEVFYNGYFNGSISL